MKKVGKRKTFCIMSLQSQANRRRKIQIMKALCGFLFFLMVVMMTFGENMAAETISGLLKVHSGNPRYFSDSTGSAVYLTGSHVWDNFQDWGGNKPDFDYSSYLEFLSKNNHNFIRLWVGTPRLIPDEVNFRTQPMPWKRTGPGKAKDGELRFDLTKFNEEYFLRLRSRVLEAGKRGIYVSLMLFNGLFNWEGHPFNIHNNINSIDGDIDKKGGGDAIFSIRNPEVLTIQKNYLKKVIDTVNDLDNVLFEIGNEIKGHSVEWQYHIIDCIHKYEKTKPKQHPVGMTGGGEGLKNSDLFNSPADWISPAAEPGQNYSYNPPAATGKKVIISDTDHLSGVLENPSGEWVWKSFLRGLNPILMDVLQNTAPDIKEKWNDPNRPGLARVRIAMGQTLRYAERVDLQRTTPRIELSSSQYCLANPGFEYLIYEPVTDIGRREKILQSPGILNRKIWVDLLGASGMFRIEWFHPRTGEVMDGGSVAGGSKRFFKVPFRGDAVLYLYRG